MSKVIQMQESEENTVIETDVWLVLEKPDGNLHTITNNPWITYGVFSQNYKEGKESYGLVWFNVCDTKVNLQGDIVQRTYSINLLDKRTNTTDVTYWYSYRNTSSATRQMIKAHFKGTEGISEMISDIGLQVKRFNKKVKK